MQDVIHMNSSLDKEPLLFYRCSSYSMFGIYVLVKKGGGIF